MYKSEKYLTQPELERFNEIVFWNWTEELLLRYPNPAKIISLVEIICDIAKCSLPVVSSAVNIVMTNDRRFRPLREETFYLMHKARIPVRVVCRDMHITQRTYYKLIKSEKVENIQPKFDTTQYEHILMFLDTLNKIGEPLARRTL